MEVVLPVPQRDNAPRDLAARPGSLRGRRLGFLDGWGHRTGAGGYTMYPLMETIAGIAVSSWQVADTVWIKKDRAGSPASEQQLAVMAGCAGVVTGVCLSGGCTAGAVGDAAQLEGRGVPTLTLCQENFQPLAAAYAAALGYPDLPLLVYPEPVHGNLADDAGASIRSQHHLLVRALLGGG